jgi:hypothetical protein
MLGFIASPDPEGCLAGLIHVWLDEACSKDKKFKKYMEYMAYQDMLFDQEIRMWQHIKKRARKKRKRGI